MQYSWLGVAVMGGLLVIGLAASALLSKDKDQKKAVAAAFVTLILLWATFYLVVIQSAQDAAFPYFVAACLVLPICFYLLVMLITKKISSRTRSVKRKKGALELPFGTPQAHMPDGGRHIKGSPAKAGRLFEPTFIAQELESSDTRPSTGTAVVASQQDEARAPEDTGKTIDAKSAPQETARLDRVVAAAPSDTRAESAEVRKDRSTETRRPQERPLYGAHAAGSEPVVKPTPAPAARPEPRPASEPRPERASEPTPTPRPEPRPTSRPEPRPVPEPRPAPEPAPAPASRPEPRLAPESRPESRPAPEPAAAAAAAPAAKVSFDACFAKAEAFKAKSLWSVAARLYEESALLTDDLPTLHKAVFAAISAYVKADMNADAQRLAQVLQESGSLNPVEAMKVSAVLKMA